MTSNKPFKTYNQQLKIGIKTEQRLIICLLYLKNWENDLKLP